jgi:Domain of unknown function (DUF1824)
MYGVGISCPLVLLAKSAHKVEDKVERDSGTSLMNSESRNQNSLEAACQLLRQINVSSNTSSTASGISQLAIQQALQQVVQASDLQILGVCADSLAEGQQVLAAYAAALELPQPVPDFADLTGPVYIKFNPQGKSYASPYSGTERGVLLSCQSADETDVNELFGALPLDLFPELP